VEVALSAQMTDLHSDKALWANDASGTDQVEKRTVPGVVAAMSQALDGALEKLLASLPASIPASPEARPDRT
jgi:hypothetical protein